MGTFGPLIRTAHRQPKQNGGVVVVPPVITYSESFPGLEKLSGWIQPGNAGNDGGASSTPHGSYTLQPNANGSLFTINPAGAYDDYYLYKQLGAHNKASHFVLRVDFMFADTTNFAACQAIEFETQQNFGSYIYNGAWQANIAGDANGLKQWRYFNYNTSQWINSGITVDNSMFAPGVVQKIVAVFQRNSNNSMTHVSLSINDVIHNIGITQAATPRTESDYLNVAVQLDSNYRGDPYAATYHAALDVS